MYFPKGFIYDLGSKSEICPVFVYGYCGPGSFRVSGERVTKTIYQDFELGFFRRVTSPVMLVGKTRPRFQASSGNSDSTNWPGYEVGASGFFPSSNQKAIRCYNTNSNGPGMEQVVQTHRTSCRSGFERLSERVSVFYAYSSISVSSSPLFYLFTSATVRIAVHTTPKCDTKPIRYVTLFTKIQDHADQKSG